ncbi:4Fe-4S dicluster domain-containing protein [bacterium]|nr:4Fe-4S dicluster domain-containing protein [bacterium]
MDTNRIYKKDMVQVFSALKKLNISVIGQGFDEKQRLVFKKVSSFQELALDEITPLQPVKSFLFPPTEKVFSYAKQDEKYQITPETSPESSEKKVLFGLRPCDVHAIEYLKKFYDGHFPDQPILRYLENTIIIGIACEHPSNACFCTTMDISPISSTGADVFLTPTENFFVIEFLTEKGKSLQSAFSEVLKSSEATDVQWKQNIETETSKKLLEKIEINSIKGQINKAYDKPLWKKYSDVCVACGGCTFDCPTCTCFDMRDVMESKKTGYRYRAWDSCSFASFTLHASGHNPRNTKMDRLRQRIMHKYHYTVTNMQTWSCTGCGRCVRVCPVGINTRSILKDIKEALHE